MMDGYINVLKPPGMSSGAVVAIVKRAAREKAGHAGTLDPEAAGVLPVMVGRATRLFDFLVEKQKTYLAEIAFGAATDTQDAQGTVIETGGRIPSFAAVQAVLPQFTGTVMQRPPIYSALKQGGQPLYRLARKGQTADIPARPIEIMRIDALTRTPRNGCLLRVACGRGTYIRTLCHDLGQALGCGGCMAALRRTMAAGFRIEEAVTLERAQEEREALLLPLDEYFRAYPRFTVQNETQEKRAYNGNAFTARGVADGEYRVYDRAGNFLSLSRAEDGELRAIKNFF